MTELAERHDVTEIRTHGGQVVRTLRSCNHVDPIPVESVVTGDVLAHLCVDCDKQLP